MRKNWLFLILAATFVTAQYPSNAQAIRNSVNDPTRVISDQKETGMALGLFMQGSYFDAIDYYQDIKSRDERNPYITYILAECYANTRDYVPASHYYSEVYYLDKKDYPLSSFYAGQMFKQQGEYKQAITWFKQFLTDNKKVTAKNPNETNFGRAVDQKTYKNLKKQAQVEIDGCEMAMVSIKNPEPVNIFNCGPNVNSPYTELSPYPLGDSMLLFSTLNMNTYKSKFDELHRRSGEKKATEHFMLAKKQPGYVDSFQWPLPFNDGGYSETGGFGNVPAGTEVGNGCYSPGGDRFYYTRCTVTPDSFKFICRIWRSDFLERQWSPARQLAEIDAGGDENTSNTMPFVAKVGKKEVLYFASNRKLQSRGGYDIWYSVIDPRNGSMRRPQNCGKAVNTKNDELTPYYDTRVGKLYFSSNGKRSFGGFDIFSATGGPTRYSNVLNMGYPINTSADEFYFIKDPVGKPDAYVVSNRIGTIALKNPTCCNDIWRIQYEPRLVIIGKVMDKKTQTIMPQSTVKMIDQKSELTTYASEDGNFIFNMTRNHSYVLTADKVGYTSSRATVSTMSVKRSDADDTVNVTIYLDSIKHSFSVSNIYYDYDQATLRAESVASLDTLVNFMKDNPSIQVEIYSHTDGKGTDDYNLPLSQRRAQSVLDYLEKNGVERQRMTAHGMGSKSKAASETTASGIDNPEGRQLNRRTEFRIIGDMPTRRVLFDSSRPGTMDQQERNLRQPEEADDAPATPGAPAPKEDNDN